jgi:hypothetical protein
MAKIQIPVSRDRSDGKNTDPDIPDSFVPTKRDMIP